MEKRKFINKKNIIIALVILLIIILITSLTIVFTQNKSKVLELSEFERIAVYGYLEDYLSVDTLTSLSNNSDYDDIQYAQTQVKKALDNIYNSTGKTSIQTDELLSELANNENVASIDIDFHGILVSDYEYIPSQNIYQRVEGANSKMETVENQVNTAQSEMSEQTVQITKITKNDENSYSVNFNILSNSYKDSPIDRTGTVIISVEDGSYKLGSCTINE